MMLKNLRTVDQWWKIPFDTDSCLQNAFETATGTGSPISYFFADIWIPVLTRDTDHAPVVGDDGNFVVTYKNVGVTTTQLTDMYWTLYGKNMLSQPLRTDDGFVKSQDVSYLAKKINSILLLNKYKYLKWIDSMGYAYNPLWNVDGSESFQFIDNHGNIVRDNVPILQFKEQLKTNSYDGTLKDTTATYNAYGGINKNGDTEQYTVSDGSAQSVSELRSRDTETHEDITGQTPQEIAGTIIPITGGDFSHIEKRVRQGNIGVTMTSQLIEAERELVRFNLIQEFFNDVNKQLLVGIYPGF